MSDAHRLVVFSAPKPGREDEYNKWYNEVHLDEVVAIPGFVAAQRFQLSDEQLPGFPESPHTYLAIYEFDRPPGEPLEVLAGDLQSGAIVLPDAIDVESIRPWAYSSISGRTSS
ncbi:MAG: DUF4286 family protein [Solirubrobacterales bacterium]